MLSFLKKKADEKTENTDNIDKDVEITVDRSAVDTKKAGTYEVTYVAKDDAGNSTSQTTTITLSEVKVTEESLHKVAQEVIAEITNENMTFEEKLLAIYKYTNSHLTYWNSSDKNDWRAEAYRGITTGFGSGTGTITGSIISTGCCAAVIISSETVTDSDSGSGFAADSTAVVSSDS